MAIDPSPTRHPIAGDLPPDENVVSTYRAIPKLAIISLICGLGAVMTFLSPWFAILGVLAIASGVLALRAIRRLPEALTGAGMANAGVGLGLLFSLAALTIGVVQMWIIDREATKFVRSYIESLRGGSIEEAMYLHAFSALRKEKTAQQNYDELRQGASRPGELDMQTEQVRAMIARLKSTPGQTVEMTKILDHQLFGLDAYVDILLTFRGPKTQEFPDETQYATVHLGGTPEGRVYAWRVISDKFPATVPAEGF